MAACMEDTIVLTEAERMELNQRASSRSGRADDARRARLILLLETGHTWAAIRETLASSSGRSSAKPQMAQLSGAHANSGPNLESAT
jgi:hypothetical protein